jgi:hypothetical protein
MDAEPSARPPPPSKGASFTSNDTSNGALPYDFSGDPVLRRRALFDVLADATDNVPAGFSAVSARLSFSSVGDQVINVAKLADWLLRPSSANYLPEVWAVVGVGLVNSRGGAQVQPQLVPPPSTEQAVTTIVAVFEDMRVSSHGAGVPFERFTRFVSARAAKASSGSSHSNANGSSSLGSEGRNLASCVVALDPNAVAADAQVLLLQLKALRQLGGGNPYVKLALRCPITEKRHGKQSAVTAAHGHVEQVSARSLFCMLLSRLNSQRS